MFRLDQNTLKNAASWVVFGVFLLILAIRFCPALPSGVHSWAQSDRFALARQYLDHSIFDTPRTYALLSEDGKVGVEFPILPMVSATIARVTNEQYLPWIMRSINLLLLLFSLGYLTRSIQFKHPHTPVFYIMAMVLSPVLIFYGFNFLPDITGLSFTLFAFGKLIRFQRNSKENGWLIVLILSGIATLIKTSCGIYLLSFSGAIGLHFLLQKNWNSLLRFLISFLITFSAIIAYDYFFFYKINTSLYAVIFMSENQPITSFEELVFFFKGLRFWFGQWITVPQIILLALIILAAILSKTKSEYKDKTLDLSISASAIFISFLGLIGFSWQMGKQFINHDYYFIATFIGWTILFVSHLVLVIQKGNLEKRWIFTLQAAAILAIIAGGVFNYSQYEERQTDYFTWRNRTILNEIKWMQNGNERLNEQGVGPEDEIFVLYASAPNTSLIYFDRRGRVFNHEEMTRDSSNMIYWLERIKPKYVIIPKKWQPNLKNDQPFLLNRIDLVEADSAYFLYSTQK